MTGKRLNFPKKFQCEAYHEVLISILKNRAN